MKKLFPVLLPVLLGFVATLSYSVAADFIGAPTGFDETTVQSSFGQTLRE